MSNSIKFYSTESSKLSQLPISNGQLIFVRDPQGQQQIYMDINGERRSYSGFYTLLSESQRQSLIDPYYSVYYIAENKSFWLFNSEGWTKLSGEGYTKEEIDSKLKDVMTLSISQSEIDNLF